MSAWLDRIYPQTQPARYAATAFPEVLDLGKQSLSLLTSESSLSTMIRISSLIQLKHLCASGVAQRLSACWWGNGLPRLRRVAGLRGRPATMGLRQGPYTYGWQQLGILHNGRKSDAATLREG